MRRSLYLIATCLVLAAPLAAHASDTQERLVAQAPSKASKHRTQQTGDAIRFIRRNLLHVRLGFWGAMVKQRGRKYRIGLTTFGSLGELFFEDRIATDHYNAYKAFYATGFAFTLVGLGGVVASLIVTMLSINSPGLIGSGAYLPLTMGLLLGGAVFGVVGPILVSVAQNRLMRAIESYNQGIFSRARKGRWRVSFQISPHGATVGAACRF